MFATARRGRVMAAMVALLAAAVALSPFTHPASAAPAGLVINQLQFDDITAEISLDATLASATKLSCVVSANGTTSAAYLLGVLEDTETHYVAKAACNTAADSIYVDSWIQQQWFGSEAPDSSSCTTCATTKTSGAWACTFGPACAGTYQLYVNATITLKSGQHFARTNVPGCRYDTTSRTMYCQRTSNLANVSPTG